MMAHASSLVTTCPSTSVRRKSRPWKRKVEAQPLDDHVLEVASEGRPALQVLKC